MSATAEVKAINTNSSSADVSALSTTYVSLRQTVVVPADITTIDQMHIVEASGVLDFWDDKEEDVYKEDDGDPVR